MKKYDVWLANLNPQRGTEVGKIRPVLIVQSDLINLNHLSTVILPFTTNVRSELSLMRINFKKGEAGLERDSSLVVDQLRAIDNKNLIQKLGSIPEIYHLQINESLKIILDLT